MKLIIESTDESMELPAGRARMWGATTEAGFRCLIFVRLLVRPGGGPDEDFSDVCTEPYDGPDPGEAEVYRLALIAFPDGRTAEPQSAAIAIDQATEKPSPGFTE